MMPFKKNSWYFQFTETALFHVLPLRTRIYLLSSLTDRYLAALRAPVLHEENKGIVGYETSWSAPAPLRTKAGKNSDQPGEKTETRSPRRKKDA